MKFQKTMIAVAVMAMAAGVQAETITEITDGFQYNKAEDLTVNLQQFNVFNNVNIQANSVTINGPKTSTNLNTLYAGGPVNLTSKVGDVVIHAEANNAIFVPPQGDKPTNAGVTITSARDILVGSDNSWAVRAESSDTFKGIILKAERNIIIDSKNGVSNNAGAGILLKGESVSINVDGSLAVAAGSNDITINADKAIVVKGGSVAALRTTTGNLTLDSKGSTQVTGNVVANGKGNLKASFTGENSFLKGKVETKDGIQGKTVLAFNDHAQWKATGESNVSDLTLKGGVVDLNGQKVTVDTLAMDSTGTIRMDVGADGKKEVGSFTVATANNAKLTADLVQNADVVTSDIAKNALENISSKDGKLTVTADVKEGLVNPGTIYGEGGKVLSTTGNSLMRDTLQLAQTSSLSLNRILMNDVRKRMGDLRAGEGKLGAWARYDGGRLSGEGGFENDFHTIQVGVDTMPLDNGVRFGLAGSYTKGDAEYARGDADMDAFGLAAYATWMGDNGMFVDGVARMAKASNDLTVDRDMKGKLDSLAVSLSGEFGWRFPIAANAYVEPQFEATYTYIDGEKMTLSNGKQEANYELGSFDSFLTRAGVLAGYTFPNNKGDVYVRASAVHEFLGDSEISGKTGKANHMERIDGKDTWVEFGLGGNYSVTPNTYVWADVERTTGASIETDYRATVGVRYAF